MDPYKQQKYKRINYWSSYIQKYKGINYGSL